MLIAVSPILLEHCTLYDYTNTIMPNALLYYFTLLLYFSYILYYFSTTLLYLYYTIILCYCTTAILNRYTTFPHFTAILHCQFLARRAA